MTRNSAVSVVLAALLVMSAVAPAAAAASGSTSSSGPAPGVSSVAGLSGYDLPSEVIKYHSERVPGFIVTYQDGEYSKVESWADASESRYIEEHDAASDTVVVAAPVDAVVHSRVDELAELTGSQDLADRAYVESVALNLRVDVPEPVTPRNDSSVSADLSTLDEAAMKVAGGSTGSGVAYNAESEQSSLDNTTEVVGADSVSADGSAASVCVVDTGLNTANGALYGSRVKAGYNAITDENATASNNWQNISDSVGHGSWVASSIAADYAGTKYDGAAPNATLYVAKALNQDGGSVADVRESVQWCGEQGADVISMSLGSRTYSAALAEEIRDTVENTDTKAVFVASGNSRMTVRWTSSPADAPVKGVVTVAATDAEPAKTAKSAYFSSVGPDLGVKDMSGGKTYGAAPDVAAPGMEITAKVAAEDGTLENSTLSGTSMATPVVSGVAALTIDANPGVSGEELRSRIQKGADPVPHAGVTEVGHGMVSAPNAINQDYPSTTQSDARNTKAVSRDAANRAMGGYEAGLLPSRTLARATSMIPSVAGLTG